jgi:peptidoglycan hydrolase-like protein with peptidoglycan-binding domain
MRKFIVAACAIALAFAWSGVPAFAADDTTSKDSVKDKAKDKMETAKDKVGNAWDKTKEKASEVKDKVKEKISGKKGGDDVRSAQQALQDKGFNPGPIDGRMGPKTKAAITDFQKKENLKVTGSLDKDTKARLMTASTSTSSKTDTTTPPAASPSTTTGSTPTTSSTDTNTKK